jgi:hypothetical protein
LVPVPFVETVQANDMDRSAFDESYVAPKRRRPDILRLTKIIKQQEEELAAACTKCRQLEGLLEESKLAGPPDSA